MWYNDVAGSSRQNGEHEMGIHERLKRRFMIGLSASGHVFVRDTQSTDERERKTFAQNALPVYSTDTREEADAVVVRHCRLGYDGIYIWPEFGGTLAHLASVGEQMAITHRGMKEPAPAKAP